MKDSERDKINYAKSELRNYLYLLNVCHGFEGKILEIETILKGVKSPKMNVIIGNTTTGKEVRQQELRDKLQHNQKRLAEIRYRTDKIGSFLDNLSQRDREIITDVYIKGEIIEKVARKNARSERMLKYDIDGILINFK